MKGPLAPLIRRVLKSNTATMGYPNTNSSSAPMGARYSSGERRDVRSMVASERACQPAIDDQGLAGQIPAVIRGEEHRGAGHVLRQPCPSHRHLASLDIPGPEVIGGRLV